MKVPAREYLKLLSKYLKYQWRGVLLLAVLLGGSIALQLLKPQILRGFIDAASEGEAARKLIIGALWFIGISVTQQLVSVGSTYMCQNVGWKATNSLREDLVLHCIKLDMDFHKSKQPGEMIERVDGDVTALFDLFSRLMLDIISNIVMIAGILILLLREDWRISLALGTFAVLAITILSINQASGVPLWVRSNEAAAKYFGFIGEQISNTEDIKSSGAVQNSIYKYLKNTRELFPLKLKAILVNFKMWNISTMLSVTATVIGLGFGGYMWRQGIITIGTVYLIFNYTELINNPLQSIRQNLGHLQRAQASIYRIQELLDIQPLITDGDLEIEASEALSLEIKNLSFNYSNDVPVLKNITLNIKPQRILGVVGRTGSGKTTLARLLARLYDPSSGEILIDGRNLKDLRLNSLRGHIAYVTQDVQLFNATIRDNVTLFDSNISDETIIKALEEIGIREWIEGMSNGLDTVIDSGGVGLSTGEAQLLALVRVFLKNPGLVILDEASSRLDPITERYLEKAMDKLLSGRSCIMIAHRLSTLERADDILILEDGEAVEYGVRGELLEDKSSRYYALLQRGIEEVLV